MQRALAGTAVPVPAIVAYDDGDLLGVPCYVMTRVPGQVIRDQLPAAFAPRVAEPQALGYALADCLAELHAVDPAVVGLGDFGRPARLCRAPGPPVARPVGGKCRYAGICRRRARAPADSPHPGQPGGDDRSWRLPAGQLHHRLPRSGPGSGRSRLGAVRTRRPADRSRPVPVLLGVRPSRRADARHRRSPRLPGFPSGPEIARRWAERTGLPLDNLDWYRAFAHFKFAVITQGIKARVKAGAMGGQDFGDLTSAVTDTAEGRPGPDSVLTAGQRPTVGSTSWTSPSPPQRRMPAAGCGTSCGSASCPRAGLRAVAGRARRARPSRR